MLANIPRTALGSEMPSGTEVAAFRKYSEATRAVDKLADAGFPLNVVTIVGSNLRFVEHVVGKLTPARIAVGGAGQGLAWGLLMGLFVMVFMPDGGPLLAFIMVSAGAIGGILLAAITWGVNKNRRSYASRNSVVASHYSVLVSQDAHKAFSLLVDAEGNVSEAVRRSSQEKRNTRSQRNVSDKPEYGVRLSDVQTQNQSVTQKGVEQKSAERDVKSGE